MKSIMQEKNGRCYLCEKLGYHAGIWSLMEEHHVFGGTANRKMSERYGLKVYLCVGHHREGPCAVHTNAEMAESLKRDAQRVFERTHTREEFMQIFGKNYLYDEEPEDLLEAGMEAAAEHTRTERAAGHPLPGIRFFGGGHMGDPYLHISKEAAARLNDEQFRHLVEILDTLNGATPKGL